MLVRSALPFSIILLFACLLLAPAKIQAVNQAKLHPIATLFTLDTLPRLWAWELLLSGVLVCTSRHFSRETLRLNSCTSIATATLRNATLRNSIVQHHMLHHLKSRTPNPKPQTPKSKPPTLNLKPLTQKPKKPKP